MIIPNPSVSTKTPSEIQPLRQFSETLDVKDSTDVCRLCTNKAKRKATKTGNVLWSNIVKHHVHTKMNEKVIESVYRWILHNPKFVQYPIANDCIFVSIGGKSKK